LNFLTTCQNYPNISLMAARHGKAVTEPIFLATGSNEISSFCARGDSEARQRVKERILEEKNR
jgi:hypothetical protein